LAYYPCCSHPGRFPALSFFTRRYCLLEARSPAELGLPFENVAFSSADGLTLRGWWIPAPGSDRAVIQLHGRSGSMDPDIECPLFIIHGDLDQ
jgi:dipeptidyl aminopeptidase/acylaminoacyl peptidase